MKLTLMSADGRYDCELVRREINARVLPANPAPKADGLSHAPPLDLVGGAIAPRGERGVAKFTLEVVREGSPSEGGSELDEPLAQDMEARTTNGELELQVRPNDRAKLGTAVRQLKEVCAFLFCT